MNKFLDQWLERFPVEMPGTYKAVYPRRIVPPGGYMNPKYFAATLYTELITGMMPEMSAMPHVTGLMNGLQMVNYRVPTFFVHPEFAQAVAQTEPPKDFTFGQIKWPLPAMLFVLPTRFALSQFGYLCPFIGATHTPAGIYPECLPSLPACEVPLRLTNKLQNSVDRCNFVYPVFGKCDLPMDYTGSYPDTLNVYEISNAPFEDTTFTEEAMLSETSLNLDRSGMPASPEEDKQFMFKVQSFVIKLLLALTVRPEMVEQGTMQRAAKVKKGRAVSELWSPNIIGQRYRAARPVARPTGTGSHASPRMHWRVGHFRNQHFGPKPWTETSPKKLIWIEPVLVNSGENVV